MGGVAVPIPPVVLRVPAIWLAATAVADLVAVVVGFRFAYWPALVIGALGVCLSAALWSALACGLEMVHLD